MIHYFEIGGFRFVIEHGKEISYPADFPSNFLKFEISGLKEENDESSAKFDGMHAEISGIPVEISRLHAGSSQSKGSGFYTYHLHVVDRLPEVSGPLIFERPEMRIYSENGLETRVIGMMNADWCFYACYEEVSPMEAHVSFLRSQLTELNTDTVFNSLLALERHVMDQGALVLHCAYLFHQGEAILFSAPSETGKSTQAGLWEKYRGSRTINGDRGLLQKKNEKWYTKGWPVCGSSDICYNETMPVRCIVMLSQAKTNTCERMRPSMAFQQLYSQITVNRWNQEAVIKAMDLLEDLLSSVPVYHLACDISENAVSCLEERIEAERKLKREG